MEVEILWGNAELVWQGKAVSCPQPGLLQQHIPVPYLQQWSLPSAGHLLWCSHGNGKGHKVPTEGDVSPTSPRRG